MTFDLPSLGFLGLSGLGLAWLAWLWRSHRRDSSHLAMRLEQFKEQVVQYSGQLDQLSERHRMLPYLAADYTAPMVGETARAYQQVQQSLRSHRDRWLAMMDIWEDVQRQLQEGSLSVQEREALDQRLQDAGLGPAIQELAQQCETLLDELEKAHPTARQRIDDVRAVQEKCNELTRELAAQNWLAHSAEQPRAEVESLLQAAEQHVQADPIAAQHMVANAHRVADQELARLRDIQASWLDSQRLEQALDDLRRLVDRQREKGFSFTEPEGDPEPLIRQGRRHLLSAVEDLKAGDPNLAAPQLASVATSVERGRHVVDFQQKLRDFCDQELERISGQLHSLQGELDDARRQREEMSRQYAETSWMLVADNPDQAQDLIAGLQSVLSQARECQSSERQAYFRVNRLLEELRRGAEQVSGLIAAVGQRRSKLDQIKAAVRGELAELRRRQERMARELAASNIDRPKSNYRFEQTARMIEQMTAEAEGSRADWPQLGTQTRHAATDLNLVAQLVQEDYDLSDQANREIEEARRVIRNVCGYYEHGVRPNVQQAQQLLDDAFQQLARQDYEDAIASANRAEQAAIASQQAAQAESLARQRSLHRRRPAASADHFRSILATAATAAIRAIQRRR